MKYMLLIYMEEQAMNETERQHCYEESTAARARTQSERPVPGDLPASAGVDCDQRPRARRQTAGDRRSVRRDARTARRLSSWSRPRNLDEAIGIAGRIPGARVGTVEIRPVIEIPNLPS